MSDKGLRRRFFEAEICPLCGETRLKRYIRHPFQLPPQFEKGQWLISDCSCIKNERLKERSARESLLASETAHPLPVGLQGHSFANFKVGEFNREPYEACQTFARNFHKIEGGQGILLLGRSGTGKTHLACAIGNRLSGKYSVAFSYVPGLLEKMRVSNVDLDSLLSADLLILDDVGSERETGWTIERLLIIVNGRLSNLKPTVFTTNYDLGDLEKRVGMRVASRILGNNLHLLLQGPDWRLSRHGL